MIKLDIKVGDTILTGKWRNKRTEVKEIGTDELGQPTINGKPFLKCRIEKLMPKKKKVDESRKMNHLKLYEDFQPDDKLYTYAQIEEMYPWQKFNVGNLEIDSFTESVYRSYIVVSEKTGELNKHNSPIYKPERIYYQKWNEKGEYKKVDDPYKK